MKLRVFMTAAFVCLGATLAVADLSTQYAEWGNGPLQVLMTKEEAAAWKSVTTDEDAKAFIDLFWARRDPTPATPVNEFRNEMEIRIAAADKNFGERKVKGSMTDRGRTLLLYGAPKRIERTGGATPENRSNIEHVTVTWVYEGGATKEMFGAPWTQLRFADHLGLNEFKLERPAVDLEAARARMIAKSITQPNLASTRPAAPVAKPAPAPVVKTELTSDAFKGAIAELKSTQKNAYENKAYPAWGEYVTADGLTFVAIGLYVPKAAGLSGDVTYFGVVEDSTGKPVLAFEEASTLAPTKDDFFVDKSFLVPGGKHRGYFGLAQNGQVVALTTADLDLAGTLDKDAAAISPLILSNNIYPMDTVQKPDHPFAFGGVRVVPKADRAFRNSDELWYFFELRNPGIPESVPPPAEGMVEVVPAASAPAAPKVQVKIDVVGTTTEGKPVKMAAPPTEMEAIAMKGVPGHYGVGTAIPLATFKPGDYTFTVKVIDTVKKTSYTLSEKFKVVG